MVGLRTSIFRLLWLVLFAVVVGAQAAQAASVTTEAEFEAQLGSPTVNVDFTVGNIVFGSALYDSTMDTSAAGNATISAGLDTLLQGSFNGGLNGVGANDNTNGRLLTRPTAATNATFTFNVTGTLTVSGFGIKGTDNIGSGGRGGVILLEGGNTRQFLMQNGNNITFSDNHVIGGDAITANAMNSGQGGVIASAGTLTLDNFSKVAFKNNSATGGISDPGRNTASSGKGGAVYARTFAVTNSDGLNFEGNTATGPTPKGGAAHMGGVGGAIFSETTVAFTDSKNVTFTSNTAQAGTQTLGLGGATNSSGRGGAIATTNGVSITGTDPDAPAGSFTFEGNRAIGGDALSASADRNGQGGAIFAETMSSGSPGFALTNVADILFKDNLAQGGNAVNNTTANSGIGGAIYMSGGNGAQWIWNDVDSISFVNNQAVAGKASSGQSTAGSGLGGAIYFHASWHMSNPQKVELNNVTNFLFEGNKAIAGGYDAGGTITNSGLGGAMYVNGVDFLLSGNGSFLNNSATMADGYTAPDGTVARGGAIFYNATNKDYGASSNEVTSFDLHAKDGDITFKGNTHGNGKANSIYFAQTTPFRIHEVKHEVNATFTADAGHNIYMYDPMESQEDDLLNAAGARYLNITVNVTKDGLGTWHLGGHNDMKASGDWLIEEGKLHLVRGVENDEKSMADIDLSATGATFTLAASTDLVVDLNVTKDLADIDDSAARIHAEDITLAGGSRVFLNNNIKFFDTDFEVGTYKYLNLDGDTVVNDADAAIQGGTTFQIREYDYTLALNAIDKLSYDVLGKRFNRTRAGVAAVTAPAATVAALPGSMVVNNHMRDNFLLPCEKRLATNIWATGFYNYLDQRSGSNRVDYDVKVPGFSVGADHWFGNNFFVGIAGVFSWPDYESADADVDGDDITGLVYGGATLPYDVNLSFFGGFGRTSLDHDRRVQGQRFGEDYDSDNLFLGFGVSKDFRFNANWRLTPFANYEYIHADVDDWRENSSHDYALAADGYKLDMHRVKLGLSMLWESCGGAYVKGEAYYQGLYGDNRGETTAVFVNDPTQRFLRVTGDKLDRNMLGLGIAAGVPLGECARLSGGYDFKIGKETQTHTGYVNISFSF